MTGSHADRIATALGITLSAEERAGIEHKPVEFIEAWLRRQRVETPADRYVVAKLRKQLVRARRREAKR